MHSSKGYIYENESGRGIIPSTQEPLIGLPGFSWTESITSFPTGNWRKILYANNMFVAVGAFSDQTSTKTGYSYDGKNWVTATTPDSPSVTWGDIAYGNGIFVAVGIPSSGSVSVMTSSDGRNLIMKTAAN